GAQPTMMQAAAVGLPPGAMSRKLRRRRAEGQQGVSPDADSDGGPHKAPGGPTPGPAAPGPGAAPAPGVPVETKAVWKTGAELKAMTLEQLKRYGDEQADWANNPKLDDDDRKLAWHWIAFALADDGNLAACGKHLVS